MGQPSRTSRIRAPPLIQKVAYCIIMCNRFKTTPDARMPVHLRWVFRFLKLFVSTFLVRHDLGVRTAHEANGRVVLLTNRPSPKHLPTCGVWVGFATSKDGCLDCQAQTYVFMIHNRVGLMHTADKISIHGSCNASIATEEAQLLLHFSQNRS